MDFILYIQFDIIFQYLYHVDLLYRDHGRQKPIFETYLSSTLKLTQLGLKSFAHLNTCYWLIYF